MIVIVDYGMGNLGSVANIIRKVGGKAAISQGDDDLRRADKLILPGVGSFDNGMDNLRRRGYEEVLTETVRSGTPLLGICLGMQLLSRRSEEGAAPGLGWIDADTRRFRFDADAAALRVPHMGWNTIRVTRPHPLFPDPDAAKRFYFVHSYHVCCDRDENVLATTRHGCEFTSAVVSDNIVGVQFHPEKSHRYGMELMKHFVEDL